jgi:hypothetical protein
MFALALSGCASTAMKGHVGKSINEAFFSYGKPENVFNLPDGRRAFQFRWGGGSGIIPGHSNSTILPNGAGYNVTTTSTPTTFFESDGCLVTLIAQASGNDFVVQEYRIPKKLVC